MNWVLVPALGDSASVRVDGAERSVVRGLFGPPLTSRPCLRGLLLHTRRSFLRVRAGARRAGCPQTRGCFRGGVRSTVKWFLRVPTAPTARSDHADPGVVQRERPVWRHTPDVDIVKEEAPILGPTTPLGPRSLTVTAGWPSAGTRLPRPPPATVAMVPSGATRRTRPPSATSSEPSAMRASATGPWIAAARAGPPSPCDPGHRPRETRSGGLPQQPAPG